MCLISKCAKILFLCGQNFSLSVWSVIHVAWCVQLFERLPSYSSLLQQTEWLKDRISFLLGGIQVIHMERVGLVLPLEDHYSTLSTFHERLLPHRLALHPRSLQGLAMTLEK